MNDIIRMNDIIGPVRLFGLAGSLRRGSYSTAVLHGLAAALGAGAKLDIWEPRLPLYNEDDDGPAAPEPVRAFRQAIAASDGIVISTPEYNHGMPGLLKSALDWASRPYGESVLIGKPTLIISSSPAFTGGVRAQSQLNETLLSVQAAIVPGPQIVIGGVADKVSDGRLVDQSSLAFALAAIDRLTGVCRRSFALDPEATV
jgi:chromate reductase, NAD(P)H dehydrogenase (quinone)